MKVYPLRRGRRGGCLRQPGAHSSRKGGALAQDELALVEPARFTREGELSVARRARFLGEGPVFIGDRPQFLVRRSRRRTAPAGTLRLEGTATRTSLRENDFPEPGDTALLVPSWSVEASAMLAVTSRVEIGVRAEYAAYAWSQASAIGTMPLPAAPASSGYGPEIRLAFPLRPDGAASGSTLTSVGPIWLMGLGYGVSRDWGRASAILYRPMTDSSSPVDYGFGLQVTVGVNLEVLNHKDTPDGRADRHVPDEPTPWED